MKLLASLGGGAYGIVYKAKHKDTGEFGKLKFFINSNMLSFLNLHCL